MRMLLEVSFPIEPFNTAVRNGTIGTIIGKIIDETKPEAIYFTERDGHRGALAVVNVASPDKVPSLAEPWFISLNADCRFRVAMTPDDLQRAGLDDLGKKWG